jgi:hypothetical protein
MATITGTTSICDGGTTNVSIALTGTAPWSLTYTDGTSSWDVTNILSTPHTISVSPASTRTYTVTALSDANSCSATAGEMTGSAVITVRPAFTAGAINTTGESICYNADASNITSATAASGGDGDITYKWEYSTDGYSWTEVESNTADYDPGNLEQTTVFRRYAKDGTCSLFTLSSGTWTVTVNPELTYSMTDNANNTSPYKKEGDTLIFTVTINGGTPNGEGNRFSYSWPTKPTGIANPTFVSESVSGATTTSTFILTSAGEGHNGSYSISVTDANSCNSTAGSASTTAMIYPTNNIYVNVSTGGNETGTGWPTKPVRAITKAVDIATAGNTINVMDCGATPYSEDSTYGVDNGALLDKVVTIKHVNATSPYATLSTEVLFPANKHFVIAVGSSNADSITFSGFTPSALYVNTSGDIQNAINAVTSTGTVKLLAGDYSLSTTQLNVVNGITIQGPSVTDGSTSCDMVPTATVTVTGTTTMFKTYGSNSKTIKNLILTVGKSSSTSTTGRFFEIASGSSGNINTENIQFKYDNNSSVTRIFGVTNADNSAGALNDVAKFVNDINDVGYGTGRVTYGNQAPLPWNDLEIGWKAEDGETATEGTRVARLNPMKNTTKIQNPGTTTTRPLFYNSVGTTATDGINSRAALVFDGVDEFLHASTTTQVNGGSAKTVFVVFQTGADIGTATDMVIYKHGNQTNGMSFAVIGDAAGNDDFELNIYNEKTGGSTQYATLDVANLSANTTYIAQAYFDGSSTNNRVGLALHDNSGDLGTSNVTSTNFDVTTLTTPAVGAATNISLGARSGSTYVDGGDVTTAGVGNYFNGKVAELIILNTANSTARDAVYCYLRNKYLADQAPDNDLTKEQGGDVVAGNESDFQNGVNVYPNPAEYEVNTEIAVRVGGRVQVTLRDALGRDIMTVFNGDVVNNTILPLSTDIRNLPSGAYMMHVVGPDDLNLAAPFMIRH